MIRCPRWYNWSARWRKAPCGLSAEETGVQFSNELATRKNMSGKEMRKAALRRYVVFRIKAVEFLDLNILRQTLRGNQINPSPVVRLPIFMSNSVRTVVLSWFALFFHKNGLNVLDLWKH